MKATLHTLMILVLLSMGIPACMNIPVPAREKLLEDGLVNAPTPSPAQSITVSTLASVTPPVVPTLVTRSPALTFAPPLPTATVVLQWSDSTEAVLAPDELQWLRANAIGLDSADVRADSRDLTPLKTIIGDAHIVALGEATHGTHEFFSLRQRIMQYLVAEMDFNVVVVEMPMSGSENVTTWLYDSPKPLEAAGLEPWVWPAYEAKRSLRWLKEYNAGVAPQARVRYYGFDVNRIADSLRYLTDYFQRIGEAPPSEIYCLRLNNYFFTYASRPVAEREACRVKIEGVLTTLLDHQAQFIEKSTRSEWDWAVQHTTLLLNAQQLYSVPVTRSQDDIAQAAEMRDRFMADNITWLRAHLGDDTKIIILGHNRHIANEPRHMGAYLKERFEEDIVLVGFSFYEGTFEAVPVRDGTPIAMSPEILSAALPPLNSYEHFLNQVGLPLFLLDLRSARPTDGATAWLFDPKPFRAIGASYDETVPDHYYYTADLPHEYDLILQVATTTPSKTNY